MLIHFARLCVPFLIVSSALSAQESSPTEPAKVPSKQPCSIAGVVVKSGTSEPLKKAKISLQNANDPNSGTSTQTDASGHFAIQNVEAGNYRLQVQRTGFVSQFYGESSSGRRGGVLALNPGRNVQDLLFRMVPWAVISGRITDEDGEPVPHVTVEAMRRHTWEGKRDLQTYGQAQTDDVGEFRLFGLAKGLYFVRAKVRDYWQHAPRDLGSADPGSSAQTGYAPVYFPGTTDVARAVAVDLAPGEEFSSVNFTLIPVRTLHIRGHVFDAVLGQPAKDCTLMLVHHDPSVSNFADSRVGMTSCEDSAFQFSDLPPGTYFVYAILNDPGKQRSARISIDLVNTNFDEVSLTVGPGFELTGRVLVEGRAALDLSQIHFWLRDPEQYFNVGGHAVLRPDGTLTIENIPEGNYHIDAGGPSTGSAPDTYIKAARANGEDFLEKGLAVGAGSSRRPLEIVLSTAGARIDGSVADENNLPSAGAVVTLVPEGDHRKQFRLYMTTTTDQYGQFVLRGIAPGTYKLFSWREVEDNGWEDPEFLAPFESQGTRVTAEESGHIAIRLKSIPTENHK
jgi:5-hydroxyisourate hydrolase-like protein (transthyretin family)